MKSSGEDRGEEQEKVNQDGQEREMTLSCCKYHTESSSAVCFGRGYEIQKREDGCTFTIIIKTHVI